jgi:propanediol dehydratase small subunit
MRVLFDMNHHIRVADFYRYEAYEARDNGHEDLAKVFERAAEKRLERAGKCRDAIYRTFGTPES